MGLTIEQRLYSTVQALRFAIGIMEVCRTMLRHSNVPADRYAMLNDAIKRCDGAIKIAQEGNSDE